jgi:bifunctional DNase/RNase
LAEENSHENGERPEDLFGNPLDEGPSEEQSLVEREVTVAGVFEQQDQSGVQPSAYVVLLRDSMHRSVPIWIGRFEAIAISLALEGSTADRPLPYDMIGNVITKMGGTVERILIDDLWNNTYYAKISIAYDGRTLDVDSRPSDAIALGLRVKSPIYMAEAVLEKAAVREE